MIPSFSTFGLNMLADQGTMGILEIQTRSSFSSAKEWTGNLMMTTVMIVFMLVVVMTVVMMLGGTLLNSSIFRLRFKLRTRQIYSARHTHAM